MANAIQQQINSSDAVCTCTFNRSSRHSQLTECQSRIQIRNDAISTFVPSVIKMSIWCRPMRLFSHVQFRSPNKYPLKEYVGLIKWPRAGWINRIDIIRWFDVIYWHFYKRLIINSFTTIVYRQRFQTLQQLNCFNINPILWCGCLLRALQHSRQSLTKGSALK